MKKTEKRPPITTTYSSQQEMDKDIRPGQPPIKGFTNAEAARAKAARVGENVKQYPVKGVNDPE